MAFTGALGIRAGEGRVAARLLIMMMILWSGSALGANAIESLFFVRFGPSFLPYLYVALGVVTFAVMVGLNALLARVDPPRFAVSVPVVLAGLVAAMRATLLLPTRWVYPVLWLIMMVVWTVQLLAAWTLASTVHDTRQAKRLFPLYGSGLIVGGVVGGLGTGPLAGWLGAENLVLFWTASLLLTAFLTRSVLRTAGLAGSRRTGRRSPRSGMLRELGEGYRTVRASSLLRWMAVALALFALLYFSLSLLFARAATARFPDAARLAGFLGLFMAVSSVSGLLASLLVANRLFARFGVATMVLVLPLLYLGGFGVLVLAPAFGVLVAFRFLQMTWVNGIWATGWQALFNVVPAERRARVRTFMDGIPLQSGIVTSGVVLILAERVLQPRDVALVGVGAAALATVAMWRARRAYGGAVVEALRVGDPEVFVTEPDPFGGPLQDAAALAVLVEAASAPDPALRRVAMEIIADTGLEGAAEAVRTGLADPDAAVRSAAARAASRMEDASLRLDVLPLLADPDPSVRRAAVRAVSAKPDPQVAAELGPMLADPDPAVRAEAARRLADVGEDRPSEAVLASMVADGRPEWRAAALGAFTGTASGARAGAAVSGDPDSKVRRAAAAALSAVPSPASIDLLAGMLGDASPSVREEAVAGLAAAGPAARDRLLGALEEPQLEAGALAALAAAEGTEPEVVRRAADRHVRAALRYGRMLRGLAPDGDERAELLAHGLRHRALEHALTALRAASGLTDPSAMRLAIEGLGSAHPTQRANALEALEAMGDASVVRPLLELWEDGGRTGPRPAEVLMEVLADPDPWLRACASLAATHVDDPDVRAAVGRVAGSDADTLVRQTAASTLEGGASVEAVPSTSLLERVMFLRKVPLFADLAPADLKHVGEVVTEHAFPDGEVIAVQGEPGDELYIVLEGEIRVVIGRDGEPEREVARRGRGEYVGEMAVISQEPRMASLVCSGRVRVLTLDRPRFERILRERPEASLAMMRVLSGRLRESHRAAPSR